MLHPVDSFSVLLFLDGDVGHGGCRGGSVPVLLMGRKPDDIAWVDFFDRTAFPLSESAARGNNESLAERMSVPGRPRTGLEGYTCPGYKRGVRCAEKRIDPHRAREPICWTFR